MRAVVTHPAPGEGGVQGQEQGNPVRIALRIHLQPQRQAGQPGDDDHGEQQGLERVRWQATTQDRQRARQQQQAQRVQQQQIAIGPQGVVVGAGPGQGQHHPRQAAEQPEQARQRRQRTIVATVDIGHDQGRHHACKQPCPQGDAAAGRLGCLLLRQQFDFR